MSTSLKKPPISSDKNRSSRPCLALIGLGVVQIILGICCIIVQVPAIILDIAPLKEFGPGIWSGVAFCISGGFNIASGRAGVVAAPGWNKQTGMMVVSLVWSLMAALSSAVLLGFASVAMDKHHRVLFGSYEIDGPEFSICMLLIGFSVIEGIIAVAASAMPCAWMFWSDSSNQAGQLGQTVTTSLGQNMDSDKDPQFLPLVAESTGSLYDNQDDFSYHPYDAESLSKVDPSEILEIQFVDDSKVPVR